MGFDNYKPVCGGGGRGRGVIDGSFEVYRVPKTSIYPLLDPKYPYFGTIYPYVRVLAGSWLTGMPAAGAFEQNPHVPPLTEKPEAGFRL